MKTVTIDLEAVEADIARLRHELAEKEAVLRFARDYALPSNGAADSHTIAAPLKVAPDQFRGKTMQESAAIVLRAAGHPMKTADIVASLQAAGVGKNLSNMLNATYTAMKRRKDVFKKIEAGTWALVGQSVDDDE